MKDQSVRINSGLLKGMKIQAPRNEITRPSSSKLREAVFDMLRPELEDSIFWDLFSGSGSIGLTALSLGIKEVCFVEAHREALAVLNKNILEAFRRFESQSLEAPDLKIHALKMESAWRKLMQGKAPDIIWADPPYKDSLKWSEYILRESAEFLEPGSFFVLELETKDLETCSSSDLFTDTVWELIKTRKYGGSSIIIWRKL